MTTTVTRENKTDLDTDFDTNEAVEEFDIRAEEQWPRYNMARTFHRNAHGEEMDFRGMSRKWMRDIYYDNHKNIIIIKCAQVGITEWACCDLFTQAKNGLRAIYVFPDDGKRNDFVADRINGLQKNSKEYADAIKSVKKESDTIKQKSIYGMNVRFVGSLSRKNFHEVPADVLYIDEFDLCDKDNLPYAYDRLKRSKHRLIRRFGNPEAESLGIHKLYQKSDMHEWFVKCDKCGHLQELDWFKHFIEKADYFYKLRNEDGNPMCESCNQPFNRLGYGEWRAQGTSDKIRGYHISRLFADDINENIIPELLELFNDSQDDGTALKKFWNTDLGLPFGDKGSQITEELMRACASGENIRKIRKQIKDGMELNTIAGIDQGKLFHIHISAMLDSIRYKLFAGTVQSWEQVYGLLKEFNVTTAVIDAQGGGYEETRDFIAKQDGAWMCYFRPLDRIQNVYDLKYKEGVVNVNRTECLDKSHRAYKQKNIVLPADYASLDGGDFVKQMKMPVRIIDPRGVPVWTKGVDHHRLADSYEMLAMMISGMTDSTQESGDWYARKIH